MNVRNRALAPLNRTWLTKLRDPTRPWRNTMHRQSLLLSRPLSLCLKLKDIVYKIEPKQLKQTAHQDSSPLKDLLPLTYLPHHTLGLQEDYNSCISAEQPIHRDLILEHQYPHLRALRTDTEVGDGLWLCCSCQHPNTLIHFTSAFPFKHLTCARCAVILCPGCLTSEVLSPLPWGMVRALPAPDGK